MKKLRLAIGVLTAMSVSAVAIVACSGGDDSNGSSNGDDASGDSNATSDRSSSSDGQPTDSGKNDGAPACMFDGGASDFLNDAIQITVGTAAACAIRVDHSLVCWGENQLGYLGVDASTPTGYRPVAPQFPASAGALHFASVSAGNDHVCALDTGGHVWCWGPNSNGELGNGSIAGSPATAFLPGEVVDRTGAPIANITALAVGRHHSCAARSDGVLLCWGTNAAGELGGSDAGATSPFAIEMPLAPALGATGVVLTGSPFTLAICGASATAAPFCIGSNHEEQLASPNFNGSVNVAINATMSDAGATPPATTFAMGDQSTCATDNAGAFYCWGQNENNIFNGALPSFSLTGIPLKIPGLPARVVQGALSQAFGCLVDSTGVVTCWGSNQHGNLGSGDTDGSTAPAPPSVVVGFDGTGTLPPVANVEVGNNACAILVGSCGAGNVVCWGRGGNLGNDSGAQDSPIPLRVLAPNPDGGF